MPIRERNSEDSDDIYRAFHIGDLASLYMLETRILARDKQLDYADYITASGFDSAAFLADLQNPARVLMGDLQAPSVPYNLDAWDGYPVEREMVLETARVLNKNLVVLAGDTHNGWANDLKTLDGVPRR